jgi:hypothetical protein
MTWSIFIKGKINFRHVQIWFWVCLSMEKLTLDMLKCDFEYVCQRKNWLYTCTNLTLNMFVNNKKLN